MKEKIYFRDTKGKDYGIFTLKLLLNIEHEEKYFACTSDLKKKLLEMFRISYKFENQTEITQQFDY